ncbi:MAG: DUF4390 domain-containing protein, partial [Gammaproteobacteria bacterium]
MQWVGRVTAMLLVWLAVLLPLQARELEAEQLSLQRTEEGLFLTTRLVMGDTPSSVQDALLRGVPLYFVWRADIYRERWYWTDKRVATVARTLRLAYQPLTRRWRLSLAPEPASSAANLQYAVHQNFDTLDDSLRAIMRVVRWRLAPAGDPEDDDSHRIELSFRLDLSLLPRPFQIGLVNQADWGIEWR